ncbi:cytochrome c oxidase subunit 3 family protein [Pseudomaricurvus alkylphenolicus]|uniref:cytochrome c oxidase subunit 3 n=1 Tax=Pseudomaricurvus alkylphenolicus TaxID=1306991 RepID=UPI001422D208|nr:cytochrome c oxidase subunit 3 [Pseudomaricurvus alkylphenolicus]NIB44307.1 cytochrome c oxidase subunit 3 family protein [Pseudomaricurvus alkylphenolicus]
MNTTAIDTGARRAPGEIGIWGFVLCDLIVFSLYFMTFLYERAQRPEMFLEGSHQLNLNMGLINTLVLLASSLFVALAVQSIRSGQAVLGRKYILGAGLGGAAFIVNKMIEWGIKISAGYDAQYDLFFQLYYMMTGLHFLHVLVGMVVLTYLWKMTAAIRTNVTPRQVRFLENGAIYWHLVDLIWLVLFALFYLIK